MKRKLLLAGLASLALAVSSMSNAADLGTRPAYKALPPVAAPAPVPSWTGFYFGGNVGYSWGNSHNDWSVLNPVFSREGRLIVAPLRASVCVCGN